MLPVIGIALISSALLTSSLWNDQGLLALMTASTLGLLASSDGQQVDPFTPSNTSPFLLVQVGQSFKHSCSLDTASSRASNITVTLPGDGQTDSFSSYYFRKLSDFDNRSTLSYRLDFMNLRIIATLSINKASVLDTGFYGCRDVAALNSDFRRSIHANHSFGALHQSPITNRVYVYVHPMLMPDLSDDDSLPLPTDQITSDELFSNELLLLTLDVFVLEESKNNQIIPLKPTHPDVELFLSRRTIKGHWIEIFSSKYSGKEATNWSWDKYRGLIIKEVFRNQTNGLYWCDGTLNGRTTSRYFRLFVTGHNDLLSGNSSESESHPRIERSVDYLIYPSRRSFKLVCHIGLQWNVTWTLPKLMTDDFNPFTITYESSVINDRLTSTLNVPEPRYLDTGNYSCHRSDEPKRSASQYVFISDGDHLLLPVEKVYVFNTSQQVILPCLPSHPDVAVSLMKTGQTGRGVENITLFPSSEGQWLFNKFRGFSSARNASRSMTGQKYLCKGVRHLVEDTRLFRVFVADIELTVIHDSGPVVEGDEITIQCDTHLRPGVITWFSRNPNRSSESNISFPINPKSFDSLSASLPLGISNISTRTLNGNNKMNSIELIWLNVSFQATGRFECRYEEPGLNSVAVDSYDLIVRPAIPPRLADLDEPLTLEIQEGKIVSLNCLVKQGAPSPVITWFKDDVKLNNTVMDNDAKYHSPHHPWIFNFRAETGTEGLYTCRIENRIGTDQRHFYISVIHGEEDHVMPAIIAVLILIAALLAVTIRMLYIRFSNRALKAKESANVAKVLEPLLAGNPERFNRHLPLDGQSELLPYDKTWEFPRNRLTLGKQLGAGCFGRVLKAEAVGITQESVSETVAVKMVRSYTDLSALASLVSELKILIHLGSHLNIVNLLGACTDVANGDFLVIVEYCRFGNLHQHLISHRNCYVNQVDDDGEFFLAQNLPSSTSFSAENNGYLLMGSPSPTSSPFVNSYPSDQQLSSCRDVIQSDYLVMLSEDEARASLSEEPRFVQQPFTTCHLLSWMFQIARGMNYLSSRQVVHGDLAARNVLLTDKDIVKIADFGLSRKVYQDSNYKKKGSGMLPVKWMAPESLSDRVFSSQSDVWAFGVTTWELFSLGKAPYPDVEDISSLIQLLENGGRMEIPRQTPSSIASVIHRCWAGDASRRPTFQELEDILSKTIDDSVKRHFHELDEPFQRRNSSKMAGPQPTSEDESLRKQTSSSNDYINSNVTWRALTSTTYENVNI